MIGGKNKYKVYMYILSFQEQDSDFSATDSETSDIEETLDEQEEHEEDEDHADEIDELNAESKSWCFGVLSFGIDSDKIIVLTFFTIICFAL